MHKDRIRIKKIIIKSVSEGNERFKFIDSEKALLMIFLECLKNLDTSVLFYSNNSRLSEFIQDITKQPSLIDYSFAEQYNSDFLMSNVSSVVKRNTIYENGNVFTKVNIQYRIIRQQMQQLNADAAEIIRKLSINNNFSERAMMFEIYNYVICNISYDFELKHYTAFDALCYKRATCHGIAALICLLCYKVGIRSRLIFGTSYCKRTGCYESHAWNIVNIENKWYNLDATWDITNYRFLDRHYNFFLKGTNDFENHFADIGYSRDEFKWNYPIIQYY